MQNGTRVLRIGIGSLLCLTAVCQLVREDLWRAAEEDRPAVRPSIRSFVRPPAAVTARIPPTADQLERLRSGRDLWRTLAELRFTETTPELGAVLDTLDATVPTTHVGERRSLACYRARRPSTPLAIAIEALPRDGNWPAEGEVSCLIDVIAERAASEPERALPILVRAAYERGTPEVMAGLARLDPPVLPSEVRRDLERGHHPRAIAVAIALGAAHKWPRYVLAALEDPSSDVRIAARDALAIREDAAAQVLLARHIARHQEDAALVWLARVSLAARSPLAERLIAVAADTAEVADARAHAAWLVSEEGDLSAGRQLAGIDAADPWLRDRLERAVGTVERRFATRLPRPPDRGGAVP
jgi:hypothetical protein